jgi:proteasome lid subunit RPN8/RPN11
MRLRIRSATLATIREQVRARTDRELVGLLAADAAGVVVAAVELGVGDRTSVRVPGAALRAAERELAATGLTRAGLYHSHIDRGPAPTEADRLVLRVGEPMLIVSLAGGREGAFALAEDRLHVVPVALEVVA